MRYVRLVAVCDEYDNEPGLIVKGTKQFDGMSADRNGIMIAHDILEHQNGVAEIGSVWDELQALGGIWQVRGRHGDMLTGYRHNNCIYANIASDIARMAEEGAWLTPPDTRPHDYDEDFRETACMAHQQIRREYTDPALCEVEMDNYIETAIAGMRIGFRKAERRFGSGYGAHNLFREIRDCVASISKQVTYEGQEFILGYGGGEAHCREVHDD